MFANTLKSENAGVMAVGRSVARRQLETSIGAVVVIAALATAVAFGGRSTATSGEQIAQVARATRAPVVVQSAARLVPTEKMQANAKGDRRS